MQRIVSKDTQLPTHIKIDPTLYHVRARYAKTPQVNFLSSERMAKQQNSFEQEFNKSLPKIEKSSFEFAKRTGILKRYSGKPSTKKHSNFLDQIGVDDIEQKQMQLVTKNSETMTSKETMSVSTTSTKITTRMVKSQSEHLKGFSHYLFESRKQSFKVPIQQSNLQNYTDSIEEQKQEDVNQQDKQRIKKSNSEHQHRIFRRQPTHLSHEEREFMNMLKLLKEDGRANQQKQQNSSTKNIDQDSVRQVLANLKELFVLLKDGSSLKLSNDRFLTHFKNLKQKFQNLNHSPIYVLFKFFESTFYSLMGDKHLSAQSWKELLSYCNDKRKFRCKLIVYEALADLYRVLQSYDLAMAYAKKQLKYAWVQEDKEAEISAYDQISKVFYYLNDLHSARFFYEKASRQLCEERESAIKILGQQSALKDIIDYRERIRKDTKEDDNDDLDLSLFLAKNLYGNVSSNTALQRKSEPSIPVSGDNVNHRIMARSKFLEEFGQPGKKILDKYLKNQINRILLRRRDGWDSNQLGCLRVNTEAANRLTLHEKVQVAPMLVSESNKIESRRGNLISNMGMENGVINHLSANRNSLALTARNNDKLSTVTSKSFISNDLVIRPKNLQLIVKLTHMLYENVLKLLHSTGNGIFVEEEGTLSNNKGFSYHDRA